MHNTSIGEMRRMMNVTECGSFLEPLWQGVDRLPDDKACVTFKQGRSLLERRKMWDDITCWWPGSSLIPLALPDDILQFSEDQGTIVQAVRTGGVDSVFISDPDDVQQRVCFSAMGASALHWSKLAHQSEFIEIYSFRPKFVLIGFQWLNLSVMGGEAELIGEVVGSLGGETKVLTKLRDWAGSWDNPTKKAADCMIRWCGRRT
jgi:hypothetical protein